MKPHGSAKLSIHVVMGTLKIDISNPFLSEHTWVCPCLLKVKYDPTMRECPSQGPLLELVHVLLAKQQWSREEMHCMPRSWPRRHAEMVLLPMGNSSQYDQGAGHSGGNPWLPEFFLHCDLCSLTRSVCGHPVSGRTRVGGHADSWWLFSCFLLQLLAIVSAVRSLFSRPWIVLPDKKSCDHCWLQFAVSS